MSTSTLLMICGVITLVGGSGVVWASLREHRRGDSSRRGLALIGAALALNGALVLGGKLYDGSSFAMIMQGAIAVAVITGSVLTILDVRKSRSAAVTTVGGPP